MEAVADFTPHTPASAGPDGIAMGVSANAAGDRAVAIGTLSSATAPDTIAIGIGALASMPGEIVIGRPGDRVVICGQAFVDLLHHVNSAGAFGRAAYDRIQKLEKEVQELKNQPAIAAEALELLGGKQEDQ